MRGFTTVRDLGGPAFAFKQAIDEGLIPGPRIYPSGAMITGSGGHGDLRPLVRCPAQPGQPRASSSRTGAAAIVDSPDEIRLRVREQLTQGASQIKLVGGGGVSSPRSPLDLTTLTEAEVARGRRGRADWNTYVDGACLCADDSAARDRGGRAVHRACAPDGRDDGQDDGGQGRLAEHPALPVGGRHGPAHRAQPGRGAAGLRGHRQRLQAGEKAQAQDRVRLGHAVLAARWRRGRARC